MDPFITLTSTMAPLPYDDVDTDQIIPANYLTATTRDGLAEGLFARWRYEKDGTPDPDFCLNQPKHEDAQILVTGKNFGCGSSREHAPWALMGHGFRAVISPSFADIFRNNSLKNGLLPVQLEAATVRDLLRMAKESPDTSVTIDLAEQTVTLPDGRAESFPIDGFSKTCLLQGVDQLGYLLQQEPLIAQYEADVEKLTHGPSTKS